MAITRQLVFCIDPKSGVACTFSYADIPDANDSSKAITCAHVPAARGSGISVMQESMFFGTTSAVGKTFQTLRDTLAKDGTEDISAEFITSRVDPDNRSDERTQREPTTKRYEWLIFNGPHPVEKGGNLYWTKDVDPIRDSLVTWNQFSMDAGDSTTYFESGLAEWVHLRGVFSAIQNNEIHLSGFGVQYNTVRSGENRDS